MLSPSLLKHLLESLGSWMIFVSSSWPVEEYRKRLNRELIFLFRLSSGGPWLSLSETFRERLPLASPELWRILSRAHSLPLGDSFDVLTWSESVCRRPFGLDTKTGQGAWWVT